MLILVEGSGIGLIAARCAERDDIAAAPTARARRLVHCNRKLSVVAEKCGAHPGDFPDVTHVQSHRPLHPQPANSSPATPIESQVVPGTGGERL